MTIVGTKTNIKYDYGKRKKKIMYAKVLKYVDS